MSRKPPKAVAGEAGEQRGSDLRVLVLAPKGDHLVGRGVGIWRASADDERRDQEGQKGDTAKRRDSFNTAMWMLLIHSSSVLSSTAMAGVWRLRPVTVLEADRERQLGRPIEGGGVNGRFVQRRAAVEVAAPEGKP
jgi:hypothetical protein